MHIHGGCCYTAFPHPRIILKPFARLIPVMVAVSDSKLVQHSTSRVRNPELLLLGYALGHQDHRSSGES